MQHADIALAVIGVLILAWAADQMTGRRGLFAASLVSTTGAVCGWFLAVRVFGVSTMDDIDWTAWSGGGSFLGLVTFYLFRNTR
jgi:hypothetical protein